MKRHYFTRVRRRGNDWVAAPELHTMDLSLLFRALAAYDDTLDAEMLSETDTDKHRAEKRDVKELAEWLQNSSNELWRYTDAEAWTTCERCGQTNIPIAEMGASEFCDDCAANENEV